MQRGFFLGLGAQQSTGRSLTVTIPSDATFPHTLDLLIPDGYVATVDTYDDENALSSATLQVVNADGTDSVVAKAAGDYLLGGTASFRVPLVQAEAVTFGALTLAGAGGVALPSGATSISDAGGTGLVVSSGFVVPDTGGGVTSGVVFFDDGAAWGVTATAGEASARSEAEFEAAAALGNLTVRMRPLSYPAWTPADLTLTAVTLAQEPGAVFLSIRGDTVSGLSLDGLNFVNGNPTALDAALPQNAIVHFIGSASVPIANLTIDGNSGTWSGNLIGVQLDGSTPDVSGCVIDGVRNGVNSRNAPAVGTISDCHVQNFYDDAFKVSSQGVTLEDCTATLARGVSGRRMTGATFTGTIEVGDEVWSADKTLASSVGGRVAAVGADYVDLDSNSFQMPSGSGELFGPSGSFAFTGDTADYDTPHADFFQVFNATNATDLPITVRRCRSYRSEPFIPGQIEQERNTQGLWIAGNTASAYDPVLIENNVVAGSLGNAISVVNGANIVVAQNTVIDMAYRSAGATPAIRIEDCDGVRLERNSAPAYSFFGTNTGVAEYRNLTVSREDYATEYPDLPADAPFATLADFMPASGGDVALAFAGAVDGDGDFRDATPAFLTTSIALTDNSTSVDIAVTTGAAGGTVYWMATLAAVTWDQVVAQGDAVAKGTVAGGASGLQSTITASGMDAATEYVVSVVHIVGAQSSDLVTDTRAGATASIFDFDTTPTGWRGTPGAIADGWELPITTNQQFTPYISWLDADALEPLTEYVLSFDFETNDPSGTYYAHCGSVVALTASRGLNSTFVPADGVKATHSFTFTTTDTTEPDYIGIRLVGATAGPPYQTWKITNIRVVPT